MGVALYIIIFIFFKANWNNSYAVSVIKLEPNSHFENWHVGSR